MIELSEVALGTRQVRFWHHMAARGLESQLFHMCTVK